MMFLYSLIFLDQYLLMIRYNKDYHKDKERKMVKYDKKNQNWWIKKLIF